MQVEQDQVLKQSKGQQKVRACVAAENGEQVVAALFRLHGEGLSRCDKKWGMSGTILDLVAVLLGRQKKRAFAGSLAQIYNRAQRLKTDGLRAKEISSQPMQEPDSQVLLFCWTGHQE